MKKLGLLLVQGVLASVIIAQPSAPPKDWYHLDPTVDKYPGVSADRAYKELLNNRKSRTVVVAVIDSGVDYEHEDLKDVMWVNPREIPNNGLDDDKNGYVDDVHGWNFIGNKKGENVTVDALEMTRLMAKYNKMVGSGDPQKVLSKKDFEEYTKVKEAITSQRSEAEEGMGQVKMLYDGLKSMEKKAGKSDLTDADIDKLSNDSDKDLAQVASMVKNILKAQSMSYKDLAENIKEGFDYYDKQLQYQLNVDFDPRSKFVGDDFMNQKERFYGNNDVKGPDATHGTHVAGIIAATRGNNLGGKGIADNVRIMSIRCVPDGDERDKDVANAIRYAVDNGASIINMSFGKSFSWNKKVVDDAVKYAVSKDVLLVHAAGNDAENNDTSPNFPNDKYGKSGWFSPKKAKTWVEVGALSWKGGESAAASFSNYGKENVDIFAPGTAIYNTVPGNEYRNLQGTSMAAPVVAGVAALLRSHFPELTAEQVKDIMMNSTEKQSQKVKKPGTKDMVPFTDLCISGGVVNAFKAVELASKTPGKKKIKGGAMENGGAAGTSKPAKSGA